MTPRFINIVFYMLMGALWLPGIAWGGTITLDKTLSGLSGVVIAFIFGLCTLGGISGMLYRLKEELIKNEGKLPPYPVVFVLTNLIGGWMAGFLTFAACEAAGANDWLEMALIGIGAFGGSRTLEWLWENYFARLLPKGAS